MTKRWLSFLCVLMMSAAAAHAQFGVYGKFDLNHYNFNDGGTAAATFYGGGFGVYDDFVKLGPVRGGFDLRESLVTGSNYNYRSTLFGARVALKAPVLPIRPYVQGSVGVGGTGSKGPYAAGISGGSYSNKFTYQVLGGLDWTVFPHLDFRALEIGFGRQSGVGSAAGSGASTMVLVSSGLVFRLP